MEVKRKIAGSAGPRRVNVELGRTLRSCVLVLGSKGTREAVEAEDTFAKSHLSHITESLQAPCTQRSQWALDGS